MQLGTLTITMGIALIGNKSIWIVTTNKYLGVTQSTQLR